MRIVFTVNTYFPLNDGVQTVTKYISEGLAARGHDVVVMTVLHGEAPETELINGVHVRRFRIRSRSGYYFGEIKEYVDEVVYEANKSDFLVVVAIQCVSADTIIKNIFRINCKKVLYLHGVWDYRWTKDNLRTPLQFFNKLHANLRWRGFYFFRRKNIERFDAITHLYLDADSCHRLSKLRNPKQVILGNAVEDEFFIGGDKPLLSEKYLLCVGNYSEGKNQEFVVKAFACCHVKDCRLILIGSAITPYYHRLEKIIDSLPYNVKSRIDLLINIPREKIHEYTKNASLCLLGSKSEKQPVVIMEAMACAVPFISTDVGCVAEFPGGLICENEGMMSRFIDYLMGNESVRVAYGNAGKVFASYQFRIKEKVDSFERLLKSLYHQNWYPPTQK